MKQPEVTSLFKYRPFDTFCIQNIVNESIWFSLPTTFNDPFDCSHFLDDSKIAFAIKQALRFEFEKHGQDSSFLDDPDFELKPEEKEAFNFCSENMNIVLFNKGILSLSSVCDNILMWAHYAGNHTGVCIEYERHPENELGKGAEPVQYKKRIPSLTPLDVTSFGGDKAEKLWLTKALDWEYEKEWRLLVPKGG